VSEKQLQTRAQIVLTWFAIARNREPVLRASTVAKRSDRATLALRSKRISLVVAEFALLIRGHKFRHVRLVDIPE
jgi:hypothetical protein